MEVSDADRRKEWSTNQSGMTQTVGTDADIIGVPRSVLAAACHIIRNSEHAESETAKAMRKYALSTQAAELDALRGEAERLDTTPWKDFHGDLPDYDHPLRCVFESGIQYAVNLLAAMLKVDDWEVCDGTEEFDGDLGGTLFNIVLAALPTDQHGDPMHPSEIAATITQLRARVAGLEEGLEVLRREATILCQNSMACAANHYGVDFSIFGMPGWLADSQARIEKAAALLTQNEVG